MKVSFGELSEPIAGAEHCESPGYIEYLFREDRITHVTFGDGGDVFRIVMWLEQRLRHTPESNLVIVDLSTEPRIKKVIERIKSR